MPPPCAVCGTSGPTFACSRCLQEFYCGTACQRLAWNGRAGVPPHKRQCQPCLVVPAPQSDQEPIIQALLGSGALGAMQAAMQAADAGIARIGAGGVTLHARGSAEELAFLLERKDTDAGCACMLGNRYTAGLGVARDLSAAFAYFLQAAQGGLADAEYSVACMLSNGDGVPKDALASKQWMLKAAKHGVAEAQGGCAVSFWDGSEGFPKDSAQALQWAQAAAQQGSEYGELIMAELALEAGDSVGAAPWLERAAAQGHPRAQMLLGTSQMIGFGRSVDVVAGLEWLRKAKATPGYELDEIAQQLLQLGHTPGLSLVQLQSKMELSAAARKGRK